MKIIVCSSKVPFIRGGNEIVIEWLLQELKKRGHDVEEISIPLIWKKEEDVIKTYLIWRLLNLNESLEISSDLIIGTKFPSYVARHKNKVIWLFHQFRQIYDWVGTELGYSCDNVPQLDTREKIFKMDNQAFREAKKIFAISKNVANRLKKFNNTEAEVIYPIPPNKQKYECKDYGDYILHVGRLERNKRVDLIIEAVKNIPSSIKLIITGDGTEKKALQEKVTKYGMDNKVKFVGWVDYDRLLQLYAEAYAIIFTAYDEDYGLVIPEAFLSKKAIITLTDSGGAVELVKNDETGIVCSPNAESLADGINRAILNKNKIIEMGNNGFQIVNNLSWDYIINKLIS
jgi:glycosyltransferase involved in cell wall biosynthesis